MSEHGTRRRRTRAVETAVDQAFRRGPAGDPAAGGVAGDHSRLAAHEIKSHLAVLNGYLSLVEDGSLGEAPAIARVVPELRAKVRAIGQLVDDMLEDARLEDGRLHLFRRVIDLRDAVDLAVRDARRLAPPTHAISYKVPQEPARVNADPGRVGTILRNLLDNAIKYSPQGGTIDCLLEVEGDHAIVRVADPGVGIDPDEVDHIFRRFGRGRGRGRESASIDGIGLGLYISRTLAELHGGGISYSPRASGGSVFRLRLPLAGS